jgi:hypothetical protein
MKRLEELGKSSLSSLSSPTYAGGLGSLTLVGVKPKRGHLAYLDR